MTIKDELEARALFEQRYGITAAPLLADLPLEGLQVAAARARVERLADRASVVVAAASGLPFQLGSFDAIKRRACHPLPAAGHARRVRGPWPCVATTIGCCAPPDSWTSPRST